MQPANTDQDPVTRSSPRDQRDPRDGDGGHCSERIEGDENPGNYLAVLMFEGDDRLRLIFSAAHPGMWGATEQRA
jgi:hypothetical protein